MQSSLISVIIPVYNVELYIARCLESILHQSYKDFEIIAVDDGSKDGSGKILDAFEKQDSRVVVIHQMNQGVAVARQTGLDKARGKYVIFLDGDDWCEEDMLEQLFAKAMKMNADIVVCDYYVNFPAKQYYYSQKASSFPQTCVKQLLEGKLHGSTCNKLVKRELYLEHGIGFIPGLNMWEDLLINLKLFTFARRVAYLPQAFLHYMQVNPESYTIRMSEHSLKNIESVIREMDVFLREQTFQATYQDSFLYQKIMAKHCLIQNSRGERQAYYAKLYVDVNRKIFSHSFLPVYYRWALFFATHRMLWVANLIYDSLNFLKFLIR